MPPSGADPALLWLGLLLGAAAMGHAWFLLGWKRAAVFFGIAFCLFWAAASLNQATALASPRSYTAALGPRIGQVPALAALGWSAMLYNSHVIANLIAEGQPAGRRRGGTWTACMALLTALVLTAWDLTLDPHLSGPAGGGRAWIWLQGGAYFETPFANYLSWLQTAFTVDVAIRLMEPAPARGRDPLPRWLMAVPLAAFAAAGLAAAWLGSPEATRVLPPFAMGIPVLAALGRLLKHRPGTGEARA